MDGKAFLPPSPTGRKVAIFGNTQARPQAVRVVQNAEVLGYEATLAAGNEKTAERVFHSTASDAAKLALQANVKQLYLTHISARYTKEGQHLMLERQAQTIFPASKVVGDFDVFDI
ncbi:ribonuclease Z [Leptospira borgpetersenii serovar Hardjo-bovis]|nr:ribonuclease Z [Leptospira borgpetersenii serovar Hardjo-bovis]